MEGKNYAHRFTFPITKRAGLSILFVPRIILCKVATLAEQATRMPTNHCWINPTFCNNSCTVSWFFSMNGIKKISNLGQEIKI